MPNTRLQLLQTIIGTIQYSYLLTDKWKKSSSLKIIIWVKHYPSFCFVHNLYVIKTIIICKKKCIISNSVLMIEKASGRLGWLA